jgi:hypothetical protein
VLPDLVRTPRVSVLKCTVTFDWTGSALAYSCQSTLQDSTFHNLGKMARRQLARLLQPFVGGARGYSTGAAKNAARAGEEVVTISNAHRAADSVMEVSSCEQCGRRLRWGTTWGQHAGRHTRDLLL